MCLAALPADSTETKVEKSIDWFSIGLLATGLGCLQTVLEEGQSDDWFDSPFIVALACTAVGTLALFVIRQLDSDRPVVDLRVLRYRSLWAGSILSVVVGMGLYGALFAVPIFAQSILHFTSQQTGMLLLPSALASAVAMPVVAKLLGKFDPRMLLSCGALVIISALVQLAALSSQTGADDLFLPLIIRSFGTVLMFLPLSMATLGPIPKKDIPAATGFFSLTRQLGGSVGVALLTTFLVQREAFHRAVLVEKLVASDPAVLARVTTMASGLLGRGDGVAAAHAKAMALLDGGVNMQAAVMSFGDTFFVTGILFIVTLPLVFLLGKGGSAADAMGAH
jgi:DHA2 family multidrug resistance protein